MSIRTHLSRAMRQFSVTLTFLNDNILPTSFTNRTSIQDNQLVEVEMEPGLESLPRELLGLVLESTDSPPDLLNLITASRACYNIFKAGRERIVASMLRNALGPNLSHALGVFYSHVQNQYPNNARGPRRISIKAILDDYHHDRLEMPSNLADMVQVSQIYFMVEKFTKGYSYHATNILLNQPYPDLPLWSCPWYTQVLEAHSPSLSATEKVRIQRAFLRFDMYSQCFPMRDSLIERDGVSLFNRHEQAALFLSLIPKWEVEEMHCVRHHLADLAAMMFQNHLRNLAMELIGAHVALRTPPSLLADRYPNETIVGLPPIGVTGEGQTIPSKGPFLMKQALEAGPQAETTLIGWSRFRTGDFIQEASGVINTNLPSSRESTFDMIERYDSFNYGWSFFTTSGYSLNLSRLGFLQNHLRDSGYVFWDAARLENAGYIVTCNTITRLHGQEIGQAIPGPPYYEGRFLVRGPLPWEEAPKRTSASNMLANLRFPQSIDAELREILNRHALILR
ncbi:hypothetical protein F4677DRAFT_441577 [Hypoxylon crocopeplum]|nr:hypothetical protein F4677DRAFT_441577 [Hypoxylon crocopeplum]